MNMKDNIILTDTNIITDLDIAGLLKKFITLENVYMSDMVKHDEINYKTGNLSIIEEIKTIKSTNIQIYKMSQLTTIETKLTENDIMNYILAKDNNYILATGDKRLRNYAEENNVKVIGIIGIIDFLYKEDKINTREVMKAYEKLQSSSKTRLPKEELTKRIEKLENELLIKS